MNGTSTSSSVPEPEEMRIKVGRFSILGFIILLNDVSLSISVASFVNASEDYSFTFLTCALQMGGNGNESFIPDLLFYSFVWFGWVSVE